MKNGPRRARQMHASRQQSVAAAATAVAAVAATAAAAAVAATTAAAAVAAAVATAAAAAEAARTLFAGTGFVDDQRAAVNRLAVHAADGGLGFLVGRHLDKAEALGTSGVTVHHDPGGRDGAEFGES